MDAEASPLENGENLRSGCNKRNRLRSIDLRYALHLSDNGQLNLKNKLWTTNMWHSNTADIGIGELPSSTYDFNEVFVVSANFSTIYQVGTQSIA